MTKHSFENWNKGYGVINHNHETCARVKKLFLQLNEKNKIDEDYFYSLLSAADVVANFVMWLLIHQTYAKNLYLDGKKLRKEDFKTDPQGHLGGSLNVAVGYVGYMLANALSNFSRGWVMEQGHAVAAIDSANLVFGNMNSAHASRYDLSEDGLKRFINDFYSYKLNDKGQPDSPLGSHVNCHTAGGTMEGGYLGFAALKYPHIPLPNERLVAFLSDGAFEEQRGSDWSHRWWRDQDCGLIAPIMIFNGRRIDQRTTIEQEGGVEWFKQHLELNGFEPLIFDGKDPAAFAWSIIEQENLLQKNSRDLPSIQNYKIKIPYGVAVAPKGAPFYNAGTNYAHNLPLMNNPAKDEVALEKFNSEAAKFFTPIDELFAAVKIMQNHHISNRVKEKDIALANRDVALKSLVKPKFFDIAKSDNLKGLAKNSVSVMDAIDDVFLQIVKANPHLRVRVGNPDEMNSNRMSDSLEALEFRVVKSEGEVEESTLGSVITALNEEAVAAAAFGNKGGINIIVTYEAFAAKMFGIARQEVTFSRQQKNANKPAKWLSVPIVLTSNVWENSKNELSHQDPSFAEAMFMESCDISRVVFPADFNVAAQTINELYQTQGQLWTIVAAKNKIPLFFTQKEAEKIVAEGGINLCGTNISTSPYLKKDAAIMMVAIGSYQLLEVLKASKILSKNKIEHSICYLFEPAKFRTPRNSGEEKHLTSQEVVESIISNQTKQLLLVCHTRPEAILGALQPLWKNCQNVKALGFINEGGTLGINDMLYINKCSYAHIISNIATMAKIDLEKLLNTNEIAALQSKISPDGIITKTDF